MPFTHFIWQFHYITSIEKIWSLISCQVIEKGKPNIFTRDDMDIDEKEVTDDICINLLSLCEHAIYFSICPWNDLSIHVWPDQIGYNYR